MLFHLYIKAHLLPVHELHMSGVNSMLPGVPRMVTVAGSFLFN